MQPDASRAPASPSLSLNFQPAAQPLPSPISISHFFLCSPPSSTASPFYPFLSLARHTTPSPRTARRRAPANNSPLYRPCPAVTLTHQQHSLFWLCAHLCYLPPHSFCHILWAVTHVSVPWVPSPLPPRPALHCMLPRAPRHLLVYFSEL